MSFYRIIRHPLPLLIRTRSSLCNFSSQVPKSGVKSVDEPIKFTESDAHLKWKARYNFDEDEEEEERKHPPSQRMVIKASMAVFMIYFCILREENDIDDKLYQPLWKTVPELEIPLFESAVIQHRRMGLPTADLEAHLKQALERREAEEKLWQGEKQKAGNSSKREAK